MKNKKFTINERITLVERMVFKLAHEVQAIVQAINKTVEEDKEK